MIMLDDANRKDEREIIKRWQREFRDFEVCLIPTGEGTALFERQVATPPEPGA